MSVDATEQIASVEVVLAPAIVDVQPVELDLVVEPLVQQIRIDTTDVTIEVSPAGVPGPAGAPGSGAREIYLDDEPVDAGASTWLRITRDEFGNVTGVWVGEADA